MRERAATIGGQLKVWTVPGRGTTVSLLVPVAPRPAGVAPMAVAAGAELRP
jgi:signal transduction histidine kinase